MCITILSQVAGSLSPFVFIIWELKGRESESLMFDVVSQPAVKEIRDGVLVLVEFQLGYRRSKE